MRTAAIMLGLCGGLTSALPLHAADFTPPSGCDVYLTAQLRNCQVANFYRCAADPEGDQRVAYADGNGIYFDSRIDSETRWIESHTIETGEIDRLDMDASRDNASFSALLSEGRDDYDFVMRNNFGETRRYKGHDTLTGESVTIDGMPLQKCSFEIHEYDGAGQLLSTRSGMQYISAKFRIFLSGPERFENSAGDRTSFDDSPMRFDGPGDPGFSSQTPQYGCDMMMTGSVPAGRRS